MYNDENAVDLSRVEVLPTELKTHIYSFITIENRLELWKHKYTDLRLFVERIHGSSENRMENLAVFYRHFPMEERKLSLYTVSRVGEFNGDTILFRLSNNDIVEKLLKRVGELEQSFAYREQIFKMLQAYTYFCTKKMKEIGE